MLDWLKEIKKPVLTAVIFGGLIGCYFLYNFFYNIPSTEEWEEVDNLINEPEDVVVAEEVVDEEMLVDVKGAVHKPGVYLATTGDRVIDLIEKAGGLTEQAHSKAINFAMRVTDEMVVYIPVLGEEPEDAPAVTTSTGGGDDKKINLNKATQSELESLPGIGPAKAQAIIEYRENSGAFKAIEDIRSISGFGEKTFEKLKDLITVK